MTKVFWPFYGIGFFAIAAIEGVITVPPVLAFVVVVLAVVVATVLSLQESKRQTTIAVERRAALRRHDVLYDGTPQWAQVVLDAYLKQQEPAPRADAITARQFALLMDVAWRGERPDDERIPDHFLGDFEPSVGQRPRVCSYCGHDRQRHLKGGACRSCDCWAFVERSTYLPGGTRPSVSLPPPSGVDVARAEEALKLLAKTPLASPGPAVTLPRLDDGWEWVPAASPRGIGKGVDHDVIHRSGQWWVKMPKNDADVRLVVYRALYRGEHPKLSDDVLRSVCPLTLYYRGKHDVTRSYFVGDVVDWGGGEAYVFVGADHPAWDWQYLGPMTGGLLRLNNQTLRPGDSLRANFKPAPTRSANVRISFEDGQWRIATPKRIF